MFSYLQSSRVNLQILQESSCRQLVHFLEKIEGSKAIVLDDNLLGQIGLIAQPSLFSDRNIKILQLNNETIFPKDIQNIIYIVKGEIRLMNIIAEQMQKAGETKQFHLLFVPRKSCMCLTHLENKKVLQNFVRIEELPWNFYPLDKDVISMESQSAYHDLCIGKDPTILYQAALGLVELQKMYGRIPKIYGNGVHSQTIWEHAKQLGAKEKTYFNGDKGAIDQIIFLDRSIDLLSALATQLTYEGLIDEFFGIKQNQLTLPSEMFSSRNAAGPSTSSNLGSDKHFFLNSSEKLYTELRDKNFNEVGRVLSRNAKDISQQMNSNTQDKSVQDMKRLVDKLPALLAQKQSVAAHTTIAEVIRKNLDDYDFCDDLMVEQEFMVCENVDKPSGYIEDLIAKKSDFARVLRLMCLQCAAASGFKKDVLNHYKNELIQVYGIKVLLKISNLEAAGLLYNQTESGGGYSILRKRLNLTVDDAIEVEPKDISYVHSFYAPLTARIIEQTLKPLGWQSLKSQKNCLPGRTFEDFQAQLIGIGGRHSSPTPSDGSSLLNIPRIVLVFFVGGCTFAEIAALRFLSQDEDNNVQFVIATTKIINKYSFLDSILKDSIPASN